MNPENQNLDGYQNPAPQPPQPGSVSARPNQPAPNIYPPQGYSPMPVYGQPISQPTPPKNNKKLFVAVFILVVLLAVVIVAAVFMNLSQDTKTNSNKITRAYNSPAGLAPGMQSSEVLSGEFKLRASYVTGGDFTRQGTFAVKDGRMYFDMVTDDTKVNEFMSYLHGRQAGAAEFDPSSDGVSRNLSYDFASLLGYHYLYDKSAGEFSGFVPAVETAKAQPNPSKLYTLTTTCDTALADVKKQTSMSTTSVVFETKQVGVNKTEAHISFASLQAIDKSVAAFFDNCFDLAAPANAKLKRFVDARRQDVTKSPNFTFWQENGVNYIDVSAPSNDTPFGGELHFELTKLSASPVATEGTTGSYLERRNQFGLAYSLCKVDPVVTTTQQAGYRFLREDPGYGYPHVSDTGYYCNTLAVPSQFKPVATMTLRTATGANSQVSGSSIDGLRGLHDLTYEVEKYKSDNKRYPGPTEFRDIANSNMDSLTTATQTAFANGTLVYTPSPAGCVGTCNDFVASYVPAPNVQIRRTTYAP